MESTDVERVVTYLKIQTACGSDPCSSIVNTEFVGQASHNLHTCLGLSVQHRAPCRFEHQRNDGIRVGSETAAEHHNPIESSLPDTSIKVGRSDQQQREYWLQRPKSDRGWHLILKAEF